MENRYLKMQNITTRSENENDDRIIEGYFAVFDDTYEVWPGVTESIRKGAFKNSIKGDVRALYNHNTNQILGRTSAGTLKLKEDDHGLWGQIKINSKDSDALNVYERISRGDITGCSFGFEIKKETWKEESNGTIHYTIEEVSPLYEVSPCVFPAYEATRISSRGKDLAKIRKRSKLSREDWKKEMHKKLKNAGSKKGGGKTK